MRVLGFEVFSEKGPVRQLQESGLFGMLCFVVQRLPRVSRCRYGKAHIGTVKGECMADAKMNTMLESRGRDPLSHSLEDYLEAMVSLAGSDNAPVRAVDVAAKLGVSRASVAKAIGVLKEKGYLDQPFYGDISLTEEGFSYGSAIWRRHDLLYRFLTEKIGVSEDVANYEACQMEHAMSEESFEKWEAYLAQEGIVPAK